MTLLFDKQFSCPYCGSTNDLTVDPSEGRRYELVTDCETCCRPIVVHITRVGGDYTLDARPENE